MNYEVDAKKDDGSCVYDGNLTVWFSPFQSTGYVNAGKSELIFYINNEIIGSISTTEYSSVVPTCGMANTFSTTISIGKIDSKDYTLIIRDDLNNFIAQKNFRLVGNGCTVLQVP